MKKNRILKLVGVAFLMYSGTFAQTLNDAIRLSDNEQYEAASAAFRSLISREPANAAYYYFHGECFLLGDYPDSARLAFDEGAKIDASNPLILIGRAKYLLDQFSVAESKRNSNMANEDYLKAKSEFEKTSTKSAEELARVNQMKAIAAEAEARYQVAIAKVKQANDLLDEALLKGGPKNAQVFMEAADALIHYKNKDLDKAKSLLDKAEALQPKNPEIKILYGDIYSELNNGTLAAEYYNKALDLDPKSVKAIVNKGRLYKRSTNYEGAAEEFKNAIKIDDSFAPAHRELGECYYRLRKLEEAKAEYKRYLELSKNNCSARIRYASFLYLSQEFEEALSEIGRLRNSCDSNSLELLRVTAYSLYETKDTAKALQAIKNLFDKLSEDKIKVQDYEYYGKIDIMNGMDSLGVEMLRKAYIMDNNRCDLLSDIWKVYDKMKKYQDAAAVMLEKIQNCKGSTVLDYFNLGRSYFFSMDYSRADSAFAKVNELSPKYASGFLWRAKTNSFLDSTMTQGLAKEHYEKYIEVATADSTNLPKYKSGLVEAYRYIAVTFVQINKNLIEARRYLVKILEIDPENQEVKDWIKAIDRELESKNKKADGAK